MNFPPCDFEDESIPESDSVAVDRELAEDSGLGIDVLLESSRVRFGAPSIWGSSPVEGPDIRDTSRAGS